MFTSTVCRVIVFYKMKEHLLKVLDAIPRSGKGWGQKLETLHYMFKYCQLLCLIFECFPFLVSTHQLRTRSVFKYHSVFQMSAMWQTASCLGENAVWSSNGMGFLSSSTGRLLGAASRQTLKKNESRRSVIITGRFASEYVPAKMSAQASCHL